MDRSTNKVSWNTAESLVMEIGRLRNLTNSNYINRRMSVALRILSAMKNCVVHSLNDDEKKILRELEKDAWLQQEVLDYYDQSGFNGQKNKDYYEARVKLDETYSKFNDALQLLLEKYGYLIEKKEDRTVLRF